MLDSFGRRINYLRLSVTDRCNLRCVYCAPVENFGQRPHHELLSFEEFYEVTRVAVTLGVDKVRITGGEPLAKRDVMVLINMLSRLEGIRDLSLSTNGVLLRRFARRLKRGGLHRVNVSLDTLDPVRYAEVTRGGDVSRVLDGIQSAIEAGLTPVKINCVIQESPDEPDAQSVAEYGRRVGCEVRYIRQMDMEAGHFWPVIGGTSGDCTTCNRLRVSAEGQVRPCLFSDLSYSIRDLGIETALRRAIEGKPCKGGTVSKHDFHCIGG